MFTHLLSTFYRFSVSLLRDGLSNFAYKSKRIFVVVIIMLLSFSSLPQIFAKQIAKQTTIATQRIKKQRIINLNSFTGQSLSGVVWSGFAASSSGYYGSGRCVWDISHMYWTGLSSYTGLLDRSGWTGSRTGFDQQTMILSSGTGVLIHQSLLMSGNYLMMNGCSWSGGSIIYPGEREYLSRLILFSGELLELPPVFTGVKPLLSIVNVGSSGQGFGGKGVASGQKMGGSSTFSLGNQGDNKKKGRRIVQSSKEFESLIGQGVGVLRYQKTKKPRDVGQPNTLQISDDVIYLSSGGVLQAELVSGTIVSTSQGQQLNVSNFVLQELSDPVTILNAKKTTDGKQDVIELGTPGDHLIFSKPVMVQYSSDLPDGSVVAIEVKHADSVAWSTQGLSTQGDATCDLAGNISIPNSFAVVQSGQITFYTCGASLFTMNSVGGNAGSNDLRILIGDYGQMQVYYNGLAQIFGGNPPAAGAGGPSSRPILRVGAINVGNGANAWNTASTTGSWFDNTYNAVTNLSYVTGGLTYSVKIDWQYIAPNKTFTQSYTWTIPTGNTQPVKWYYGMDSFVAGADANDVGYYTGGSNPTAGIYDNVANIFLAQKYLSGRMWSGYVSSGYATVNTLTLGGANYPNSTTTTAGDLGFGVNWDFGTTPGTYTSVIERPVKPYVSSGVVDIVPGVGQPQGQLVVGTISNVPVTLTNAGLISSTGLHQIRFTVPTLLSGSSTGFTSNGWSCGAQTGTIILCSKTTSISSITGDFLTIPVTPTLAASGTTPTFTVFFSGGADSNVTNNTGTVIAAIPVGFNGLLTNASLWLKANAGTNCTTDGCSISKWNDVGGSNNHAIQNTGSAQPIYKSNIINGNPVINFNTTGKYLINTTGGTYRTVFAVRNLGGVGYQYLFSAPSLSDFSIRAAGGFNGTTNVTYTDGPNSGDWSSGGLLAINGRTTNTGRVNYHLVRSVSALPRSNTGYSISNTLLGRGMYGNDGVAELLIYSTGLTALDTSKIESYLATKYGITLDQSVPGGQNYILTSGSISWSTGSAGIYNNDIAGISRDDTIGLNQMKSQSINSTTDIIVEKTSSFANGLTLMWGNNGASTGSRTTTELSGAGLTATNRIAREWQFQEKNGDIGSVTVTYPILTGSLPNGTITLLSDTDGNFSNGGTTEYTGSIVSGYLTFVLSVVDNTYITFGLKPTGSLCIEGPEVFDLGSVSTTLASQTTELQSDYFIVNDWKGINSGYYTTLSFTGLVSSGGGIISLSSMQFKADPIVLLSGSSNSGVVLSSGITSYLSLSPSPLSFIKRDPGANGGLMGEYGSKIWIKTTVPSYQQIGTYLGTITYTLYEN